MIGFYVHHYGRGHWNRACAIIEQLDDDVTIYTSLDSANLDVPTSKKSRVRIVTLPLDTGSAEQKSPLQRHTGGESVVTARYADPSAGGQLHWAPLGHQGLLKRSAALLADAVSQQLRVMVVDVSVEVTMLCRAAGIPVIVGAMPGYRNDGPHALGYSVATAIIAPWPQWVPMLPGLDRHRSKVHAVGGISRFGQHVPETLGRVGAHSVGFVLVLFGGVDNPLPEQYWSEVERALRNRASEGAVDIPQIVLVLGPPPAQWVPDPWPLLCSAAAVITHAGQGTIADVAAANVPAIVCAQPRPFQEQLATANILGDAGLARVVDEIPRADDLAAIIAEHHRKPITESDRRDQSEAVWHRWGTAGAAVRAARIIENVAQ